MPSKIFRYTGAFVIGHRSYLEVPMASSVEGKARGALAPHIPSETSVRSTRRITSPIILSWLSKMLDTPSYQQSFDHLKDFISNLPSSKIKFVYFLAHKLDTPLVKSEFRKLTLKNNTYYLIHGSQPQFIYAYKTSDLQLILAYDHGPNAASLQPSTFNIIEHSRSTLLSHSNDRKYDNAYAGNHVDFATLRQRDNDTLFKVHYTWYDNWFEPVASRSTYACNYKMSGAINNLDSIEAFKATQCLGQDNLPIPSTCAIFKDESDIVLALTRIACGLKVKTSNETIQRGGKKYVCRYGCRGGRYIMVNGKKKYLTQRGGATSIFDDDNFLAFIKEKILVHVAAALGDRLNAITIIYDEANVLSSTLHDMMLFRYDMDDLHSAAFYYIDANVLKTAFFASNTPSQMHTELDKQCLAYVHNIAHNMP